MPWANSDGGVTLEKQILVPLSVTDLAEAFCELDDERQAQFFIEVARTVTATWDLIARHMQPAAIGKHLLECECSTYEARQFIRDLAESIGQIGDEPAPCNHPPGTTFVRPCPRCGASTDWSGD